MPNITRIVGMHNHTPEANRDAVWAGLVIRDENGTYQFVAFNGRRYGYVRETRQPQTIATRANTKFDQMYREKLAHGYVPIDWTTPRYGLIPYITRCGDIAQAESIMPAAEGQGEAPHPQVVPVRPGTPRRISMVRPADDPAPVTQVPEPSVDALIQYISGRTDRLVTEPAPEPEAAAEPKPAPKADQPPIRRARRLDF